MSEVKNDLLCVSRAVSGLESKYPYLGRCVSKLSILISIMVAGLSFESSGKLNKRLIQIMDEMRESFNQQKGTKLAFINIL